MAMNNSSQSAQETPGAAFISALIAQVLAHTAMTELGTSGAPQMSLSNTEGADAGYVRLWKAPAASPIDRMAHVRLSAGPVQTQLLFIFSRSDSAQPHFHAQSVEFPPDGCVYNIDFMPRLDAIEHPEYFTEVFSALTKPYLKATTKAENSCSKALMNPTIAPYLSPWGIVSHRTDAAELLRVQPMLECYLTHYLYLIDTLTYAKADSSELKRRNKKHLERFFDDDLDPRAWRGVYGLVGESTGKAIKDLLQTSLG
jgi:hypothetical protein